MYAEFQPASQSMTPRARSVLIGIGQVMAMYAFFHVVVTIADLWNPSWEDSPMLSMTILVGILIAWIALITAYPLLLLIRKRHAEAVMIFLTSMLIVVIMAAALLYFVSIAFPTD
jgi:hypothetical protein